MEKLTSQNLGGYILEEELGRGSIGSVYRGTQLALGRDVAVKIFSPHLAHDPSFPTRFLREAQIIARLNHPNIVHIYDAGRQGEVLYFVMEWVQGPTMGSLLRLDGSLPQHLAVEYVAQVADALDAAYQECGVIHRDIKPENLMLDRWGKMKVLDFGLARVPDLPPITTGNTLIGSLAYTAPEQIRGQALDNRSDIYALGVVLYEMITGSLPFAGSTLQELAQAITAGQILPLTRLMPEVSPELEQIVLTALATNRDERFAQAALMAEALRALHLRAPSVRSPGSPPETSPFAVSAQSLLPQPPQILRPSPPAMVGRLTLPMREPQTVTPRVLAQHEA